MSNNEVKYSIAGGSLALAPIGNKPRPLRLVPHPQYASPHVNQRKCKHETVRFVPQKIVRKDNLKFAERRRTFSSVSILFL